MVVPTATTTVTQTLLTDHTMKWTNQEKASMHPRLFLCGVFVLIFVIGTQSGNSVAADKKPIPPTAKDLVGVWIGFDSDELTFTRLDLRADSTGFCARVSPADTVLHDQGVHVYRITKWSVNGWNLEIHMSPASNAFPVGYVKARIGLALLRLMISGLDNGGWKEEPFLYPESRITIPNQETANKIDEEEKKN